MRGNRDSVALRRRAAEPAHFAPPRPRGIQRAGSPQAGRETSLLTSRIYRWYLERLTFCSINPGDVTKGVLHCSQHASLASHCVVGDADQSLVWARNRRRLPQVARDLLLV